MNVSYLYNLSNFFGPIPYNWATPFVDKEKNEIFVLDRSERGLSVFNERGMEVYRFDRIRGLGSVLDGAIDDNSGNIVLLVSGTGNERVIIRCDYRGEPLTRLDINKWSKKNLPKEFSDFSPERIVISNNHLYLADRERKKIVVIDNDENLKARYDIEALIGVEEKDKGSSGLVGFGVDPEGNMYFTIPTIFRAYRLSSDGKVSGFGTPGGRPGAFGIVSGIGADSNGNIFVSDLLKGVVMVFDKGFRFLTEFGNQGLPNGGLFAPKDLVIDNLGRVYVAQAGKKGISVFEVKGN